MAPVAEAGGGVRLQFGFPLGSFVARPCGSCGSSSSHSHRSHRRHNYAAKKSAARRAAIAEARAEKAAARRAAIAEARRQARLEKRRVKREEKEVAKFDIEEVAPDTAPLPVRPEAEERADVAIGQPKVIIYNTKAEPAENVAAAPVPAKKAEAPIGPTDCKKFVPSAGLTITVPCQ
jgi:hypothetical protein